MEAGDSNTHTILVVDDNPNNLGVVVDYLETFEFRILTARDGETGLSRAEQAQPDLILLDVMMPGIDGFETCRRLKSNTATQNIPVIFMTALAEAKNKVAGFEVGAVDYITKPIQQEEMLARIKTHIRLRELTDKLEEEAQKRAEQLLATTRRLREETKERQKADKVLEETEQQYQSVVVAAAAGIVLRYADGTVAVVNPAAERILGFTAAQIRTGESLAYDWQLTDEYGKSIPPYQHPTALALNTGQVQTNVIIGITRPDNSHAWVLVNAQPMFREDDTGPYAVVSSFLDITTQKNAEAERQRLHQEVIAAQQQAIAELSSPVIPIMDRVIVMPLVGNIDSGRARDITRALLSGISRHRAKIVIIDITGVSVVDSDVVGHLNKAVQAARLKGSKTILTGIADVVAEAIVDLGIDWSGVETLSDLQTGLRYAVNSM